MCIIQRCADLLFHEYIETFPGSHENDVHLIWINNWNAIWRIIK